MNEAAGVGQLGRGGQRMMDMGLLMGIVMGAMMVAMMGGAAWVFVRKLVRRKPERDGEGQSREK